MSRRNAAEKRPVLPDPQFNSRLATMIVARLMKHGKKSTAQRILSDAFQLISQRSNGADPLEVFETAVRNATPLVEVRARRVGGATYQVPMEVRQERGTAMALRWLVNFSRTRNGRSMAQKLAGELIDAANEAGNTVRKREETHKMAEANKAFAHYRY
uniref:Small ribosomal subunit protein uS7c n=1 Tax=Paulinella chromatophora TaxID=39717 RepID=RR7_PAUCH|nr:30S ribosomal protein S7 [Paulinella chromatophora]B1X4W8.1 RecName: Full=Small ribosomal subunit protein uS7c; AltName: Full=30S ribosomal protein S7, organellar chromatophore [Paulinella chromatophora]ACB42987.1 30S ribosomal protein S7 [Paulinella chromatophora]